MAIIRRSPGLRVVFGGALLVLALWALLPSPMVEDAQAAERTLTAQIRALVRSNAQMSRRVDRLENQLTALNSSQPDLSPRVADLEYTLGHFSRSGNEVTISGANLHIENGSGRTDGAVNSLGNLIIGYNEMRYAARNNVRTGSHMLVVGICQNYSSYGGIVAGYANSTSGRYSSVTGGHYNSASGEMSSVSGGRDNWARGEYSSVSGGFANKATGEYSSVSGGSCGTASGEQSSVSGGKSNMASGEESSVSGGDHNHASGLYSSVSGGRYNTAGGTSSSVSGGSAHEIPSWGTYDWVAGLLWQGF